MTTAGWHALCMDAGTERAEAGDVEGHRQAAECGDQNSPLSRRSEATDWWVMYNCSHECGFYIGILMSIYNLTGEDEIKDVIDEAFKYVDKGGQAKR